MHRLTAFISCQSTTVSTEEPKKLIFFRKKVNILGTFNHVKPQNNAVSYDGMREALTIVE